MKKTVLKKLKTLLLVVIAVVALVELQKFMKKRCGSCAGGVCGAPEGSGLAINPFPKELAPTNAITEETSENE